MSEKKLEHYIIAYYINLSVDSSEGLTVYWFDRARSPTVLGMILFGYQYRTWGCYFPIFEPSWGRTW